MAEKEENNGGGNQGGDYDRNSFLDRLTRNAESSSGSGDTGSDSNGSGSGENGSSSVRSDSGSLTGNSGSDAIPSSTDGATGGDSRPTGTVGLSGSGGGGRDYSGKRGRHPADCICGNCVARRAARESGIPFDSASARAQTRARRTVQAGIPESVDWADIFPGMETGKAPKIDDLFSLAYATVFQGVAILRKEDHWEVTKEEAAKLGKVSVACMNTVPAAAKAKVEQKFSKYLPWLSLIGFGMVITYPRVQMSLAATQEKKRNRFPGAARVAAGPVRVPEEAKADVSSAFRESPGIATGGDEKTSSFPPGHGKNFPPLDYQIPS